MANEVTKQDEKMATQFEVNGNPVKLSADVVKNFLVSGNGRITDSEAMMFISLCRYQHLNPFLNEAYLVKFGNLPRAPRLPSLRRAGLAVPCGSQHGAHSHTFYLLVVGA